MPTRRSGKANSRQSRQKRQQQRSSQRASLQRPMEPTAGADAAVSRPGAAPGVPAASPVTPARPTKPASRFEGIYGASRLSEQAHLEYHYVERDLRNIGILILVMLALLAVATLAFNLLGIGPR